MYISISEVFMEMYRQCVGSLRVRKEPEVEASVNVDKVESVYSITVDILYIGKV